MKVVGPYTFGNRLRAPAALEPRVSNPLHAPFPYAARRLRHRWPHLTPSVARLIAERAGLGGAE